MAAAIIYFGQDYCHRVQVLRSSGFDVSYCLRLQDVRRRLCAAPAVSALLADAEYVDFDHKLVTDIRALSAAPIVLFVRSDAEVVEDHFDLVIHSLTSPQLWLKELSLAIEIHLRSTSERTWRRPPVSIADGLRLGDTPRGSQGPAGNVPIPQRR